MTRVPGFFDKLLGKDVESKVKTIEGLGNLRSPDVIAKLTRYLGDENAGIRIAASASLEQQWLTGDAAAIAALTKALGDPVPEVRKNAALALGEFVSKAVSGEYGEAKQGLIRLLERESDPGIIKNAVLGLAHIQDEALIDAMVEALKPKDKKTVAMAIDATNDMLPTKARLAMKRALRSIL